MRDLLRHSQRALISTLMRSRYFRIFALAAMFFLLLVGVRQWAKYDADHS